MSEDEGDLVTKKSLTKEKKKKDKKEKKQKRKLSPTPEAGESPTPDTVRPSKSKVCELISHTVSNHSHKCIKAHKKVLGSRLFGVCLL